jgi:hypothetical protein
MGKLVNPKYYKRDVQKKKNNYKREESSVYERSLVIT